jgi:excisionase family DNA binding protein
MDNLSSKKESVDSAEAVQALEAGIKILARMIVKAITAELREQERFFGVTDGGQIKDMPSGVAVVNTLGKHAVYSVEEAAKVLGISRATSYECVRTGEIPSIRFGKRILVPRAALLKLLEEVGSFKSKPN